MKKFIAIVISTLFVLGLAATAFAIHAEIPAETQAVVAKGTTQITLGGSIRVRGDYRKNMDFNDDTASGDKSAWDQRTRLSTAVKVSDQVEGLVTIEAGTGDTDDVYVWGNPSDGASGVYQRGNAKRGDLKLLEAWIQYTPDLVGVKIGHMPLALGNKVFFDHTKFGDDALVLFKNIDNVHVAVLTSKFVEGTTSVADDADAYVALLTYKGEGFNLSGDITWVDDNFSFGSPADLYNIGVRGDVTVANFNVYGDVEFQTGSIEGVGGAPDLDFGGWAAQVGATTKLNGVGLGLEFGYGSGDDNASDNDIDLYVTSLSPGIPYITYVHGTRAGNAGGGNGISNITYVKGSVDSALMDNLTGKLDIVWLQASEDVVNGAGNTTDELGVEVDAYLKYKLARGLVYFVEAGYLFPGEAYDMASKSADDAYAIRHGIELTF
ncbi:MAG: alginate export family protein [Thermodesulfovibrionales bacterium]